MAGIYDAIVVGAGPGGLSTTAALLDTGVRNILWVDRDFTGGRLNTLYREISSNTKTGIYLDAIHLSGTCEGIMNSTPKPNAVTRLEEIDRDETCQLSLAGDVIMMLIRGLLELEGMEQCFDEVTGAELKKNQWTVTLRSGRKATAPQLHLSTGSHPRQLSLHEKYNPSIEILDLDQTMILSSLPSLLPSDTPSVVGIIGNSHSGILAAMNVDEVATLNSEDKRDVKIINFQKREIRFAEYREDGIVWDNSGLKGKTADWAKEHMVDGHSGRITQIRFDKSAESEDELYKRYLPECTHLIYAIGYDPNPLPRIMINSRQVNQDDLEFDMHSSGFTFGKGAEKVHGLYGTGIAFPEETEDPEGHVEAAVGFAKFMKFAERVKEKWGKVA